MSHEGTETSSSKKHLGRAGLKLTLHLDVVMMQDLPIRNPDYHSQPPQPSLLGGLHLLETFPPLILHLHFTLVTYLPTYKNDRQFDSGYLFSHQYTFNNFCSKIFHHLRCRYNEKKDTHNLFGTDNFLIYILWTQQTILINNISPVCSWTGDNSITKCGQ